MPVIRKCFSIVPNRTVPTVRMVTSLSYNPRFCRSVSQCPTHRRNITVKWYPGDLLVLYSDGITEAFNPNAEMYGFDRFKALISEKRHLSPEEIKEEILSDLQAHQQDESTTDDITLVVAKFL